MSINDLRSGYEADAHVFRCAYCETTYERGVIYPSGDVFVDARRTMIEHIKAAHGGPFHALCDMSENLSGLTDIQRRVIELSGLGLPDREIARKMGGKSASTIRNHRFQLKKRAREAKIVIALIELLSENERGESEFIHFHDSIPTKDERIVTTQHEAQDILNRYFPDTESMHLNRFPKKEKEKLVVLKQIATQFHADTSYSESEVNEILIRSYDDYATIRRYLIDYRFMSRAPGGKSYRLTSQ